MSLANLSLWTHLVLLVFLVGYALFWTIVAVPHAERPDAASRTRFLTAVRRLRVPPFGPLRVPLPALGWLGLAAVAATGVLLFLQGAERPSAVKLTPFTLAVVLHLALTLRPSLASAAGFLAALLVTACAAVAWPPGYRGVLLAVHLTALLVWLGHMFFWSFVVGPLCKRHGERAFAEALRAASHRWGALGGGALAVLFATGVPLLLQRQQALPAVFGWKLALVGGMVLYQMFVGHRRAPRLVYANMLAALVILLLSVLLVHGT